MPAASAYEYALVRVVPEIVREEFVNAGVLLYCRQRRFLAARVYLNEPRLLALCPGADIAALRAELELIPRICAGGSSAGPIGALAQAERFRWLASPRNTVVQMSAVHAGLCDDPEATMERLFREQVAVNDELSIANYE